MFTPSPISPERWQDYEKASKGYNIIHILLPQFVYVAVGFSWLVVLYAAYSKGNTLL